MRAVEDTSRLERWWRLRSLAQMNQRFGEPEHIEGLIDDLLRRQGRVRLLELGFGEGRVLLELRRRFPTAALELFGINDRPTDTIARPEDFRTAALALGLLASADAFAPPQPLFGDAGRSIALPDASMDIVISQAAFHYVLDKARAIEEIWRVLRPGGRALIHADSWAPSEPDAPHTPRLIIWDGGQHVPAHAFLRDKVGHRRVELQVSRHQPSQTNLVMDKIDTDPMSLGLSLHLASCVFDPETVTRENGGYFWGTRSAYGEAPACLP